ncbi:hypothetical protein EDEG_01559 [Edhazardia aedis USNM 41457]|uniref:RRM domain-containing protein n=1 Tax=Edhazardia aedis (strain USNM 41457) TaxID=1003232 RepID=J9DNP4_EDHAE|nr:hypothetical protein EDEG_01559 [Edhazardia aedis USNM 41457]|eukprot:EJW04155.1 hypothetical protein EDEG_01559 [Edhazardia aedis USNM 41457]
MSQIEANVDTSKKVDEEKPATKKKNEAVKAEKTGRRVKFDLNDRVMEYVPSKLIKTKEDVNHNSARKSLRNYERKLSHLKIKNNLLKKKHELIDNIKQKSTESKILSSEISSDNVKKEFQKNRQNLNSGKKLEIIEGKKEFRNQKTKNKNVLDISDLKSGNCINNNKFMVKDIEKNHKKSENVSNLKNFKSKQTNDIKDNESLIRSPRKSDEELEKDNIKTSKIDNTLSKDQKNVSDNENQNKCKFVFKKNQEFGKPEEKNKMRTKNLSHPLENKNNLEDSQNKHPSKRFKENETENIIKNKSIMFNKEKNYNSDRNDDEKTNYNQDKSKIFLKKTTNKENIKNGFKKKNNCRDLDDSESEKDFDNESSLEENEQKKSREMIITVNNISHKETKDSLKTYFKKFGKIINVDIEMDNSMCPQKAYITFDGTVNKSIFTTEIVLNDKILRVYYEKPENKKLKKIETKTFKSDRRIRIHHMKKSLTTNDVRQILKSYDFKPIDINLHFDIESHKNYGYCFVSFKKPQAAKKFIKSFGKLKDKLGEHAGAEYSQEKVGYETPKRKKLTKKQFKNKERRRKAKMKLKKAQMVAP